jgi:hypothetical protein
MSIKKHEPLKSLTPEKKVQVAYGHICLGIEQHKLAAYEGIKRGRISEAIIAIRKAAEES